MNVSKSLPPGSASTLSSFAAIYGVGYLSYMLMPLQIGALIESLNLNEAQVGTITTAELLALALTLFVLATKIASLDIRKLAMSGALLVIVGYSLSAIAGAYNLLVYCRICTGIGAGMVLAAGNAIVAGSLNPQRLFAIVLTIGQLQATCFLIVLPGLITRWAHAGIYGFLAVWTMLMLILLNRLPETANKKTASDPSASGINLRVFLLPSVLAMVFIGTSDASLWTFQERIADALGLDDEITGLVLGGALISGMLGAATAAIIGTRFGKTLPILCGLLWMAVCYLVITHTQSQSLYIIIELYYLFAYGFVIPYLYGLNGELDPQGGAMVAANGCNLIGISLGPVCAGYIIVNSGYPAVGFTITLFVLIALTIYLLVIKKQNPMSLYPV